jgi:LytS/YehU family sensor histidine kinase
VQEDIDSDEIFLPPLSIQPIVENSIKHGFFILFDKPGLISIDISQQGRMIYIVVQDNGRGIQQKVEADLNSKRIHSLDVIQKRFGYFKKLYNIDISISIQNIDEAETIVGTKVTLSISLPAEEDKH